MTHKSVGSDAPSSEWTVAGSGFDDHGNTGSVYFISDGRPGICLSITLTLSDGTETIIGFEVRQLQPERPVEVAIGTRLLRSVHLGELAREATEELRRRADRAVGQGFWRNDPAAYERAMLKSLALHSFPSGPKRPGRRGHPPEYYARLAIAYEMWRQTGDRFAVLAKQKCMSESGLRAALGTARAKGFLTKAPSGRAGGVATEKAKAILRAAGGHGGSSG